MFLQNRMIRIMLSFASTAAMTAAELSSLQHITDLACSIVSLLNDYYSWEIEYKTASEAKVQIGLVNATHVLMQLYGVDAVAAKLLLRSEISKLEARYSEAKEELFNQSPPVRQVELWCENLELLVAGYNVWALTCPRYNTVSGSNDLTESFS